jgi:hypothetical protein
MPLIRFLTSLVLLWLSLTSGVFAQDKKFGVSVAHSGEDIVGQRLAFSLREALRSSSGYKLVDGSEAVFRVNLITIDPERNPSAAGTWTAASVTFLMTNYIPYQNNNPQTWYPIYLTSLVVTAGTQRVDEQAKGILASLDAAVEEYKKAMKSN